MTGIHKSGWPWIGGSAAVGLALAGLGGACAHTGLIVSGLGLGLGGALFMLYFHRDPDRRPPADPDLILAGADGLIRRIETLPACDGIEGPALRLSIYLSPLDVHINRSPIAGEVRNVTYTPGLHLLTWCNRASEMNEHSAILIRGPQGPCLVHQIVGPVVRRVVAWLTPGQPLAAGERFGMMRFGSRLDTYLPANAVEVLVQTGDPVRAGETPVARWTHPEKP
ncbi:MAG: phosphatidylserine decarboxylase [Candidatus Marinimicrobia bacterium]|nr:phosphatidylserine decarboxylase [Candidatus Neomarinimicrobiota bacterium]